MRPHYLMLQVTSPKVRAFGIAEPYVKIIYHFDLILIDFQHPKLEHKEESDMMS
jgi:hypothetical protein